MSRRSGLLRFGAVVGAIVATVAGTAAIANRSSERDEEALFAADHPENMGFGGDGLLGGLDLKTPAQESQRGDLSAEERIAAAEKAAAEARAAAEKAEAELHRVEAERQAEEERAREEARAAVAARQAEKLRRELEDEEVS
ncbi:MAG: hypothetical protein J6T17_02975, partial [Clostridia bacterium]|nr:hypothetical protein [Clostridia bacterium]